MKEYKPKSVEPKKMVCDLCFKELDYKPVRLVKETYQLKPYKQYARECYWNICKECEYKFKGIIRL